jgi:hypothetical protein
MAQDVSAYPGNVLFLCGGEDDTSVPTLGTTNDLAREAHDERFGAEESKTWVLLNGVGHGGFGDYDNPDQPVGSLGREGVTSSVRHFLLAWLLAQAYGDAAAYENLTDPALQPDATGEFLTTMTAP